LNSVQLPAKQNSGRESSSAGQTTSFFLVSGVVSGEAVRRHKAAVRRPQGARLIGVYDSQLAFGQSRVLLVWTRLIMPNGRSIVLQRQQARTQADIPV